MRSRKQPAFPDQAAIVTRPHRKPAPPGRVQVVCTGRGDLGHGRRHLRMLQLAVVGDEVRVQWDTRQGTAPETGFRWSDGTHTFEFRCAKCGRNPRIREPRLVTGALALAAHQGILGADNSPIQYDISKVERL